jgi:predicted flap endonuclease-1-like 5' DNA nuclease
MLTEPVAAAEPAEPAQPAGAAADETVDDDLERVEGIGPRMAAALRAAGIRTFGQLAGADTTRLRAAISAAGLSFAPSLPTWPQQARLLADGDEAGFAALTKRLVAGRQVTAGPEVERS